MTVAQLLLERQTKIREAYAALKLIKTKKRPERLAILAKKHNISVHTVQKIITKDDYALKGLKNKNA